MKAKRIWAILLSLAVLIGVMPMAGLMIGATEETTDGLISIDKGDTDAVFTDAAGTVNVTAPSGKLPYAVSEDGKTVYVANNKTTIGSDKTPVTDYVNTQYTDWGCFDNNGSYLVNTYNKLTQDKELNVVYFGGSLTAGYGCGVAGDPNGVTADGVKEDTHSWRGLSGKWLQQNFPNAAINLVNCAIGESGTYLGTYRVQNDIIAAQPDLLFIEYAINDNYSEDFGTDKAAAKRQLETIVREVKSALPTCDIVIVLTTDINQMATTYSGGFFDQAAGHYELAEAYGLPVMNIGLGLAKNIAAIENNETWWTDYWTDKAIWGKYFCDFVHPYSTGHEQYFLCVEEFLENNLLHTDFDGMSATATYYPPVVSENLFDGNRVTLFGTEMQSAVDTANSTGVSYNSGVVPGGLGSSQSAKAGYYSVAADGSITINFTGTEIALWNNLASGGTTYTYSIDGGTEQTLAKSEHSPTVFAKDLPSKAHTLTVSANAAMYIVGIFSRDAAAQTVQGTAFTYADGRKPMTLTLPEGDYTLGYAATVGELPLPTLDDDATFFGWSTDGELLADTAALPVGATLKATDSSMVKTVYVSGTSGADTNDGTEATPFASLSAAMAAIIAEQDDYYAGEIVILDSVTASSTDAFGATNWTIPVTVKGSAAANTLTLASKLYLYGDTTFDNITVATNGETIYARRNAIHFTSSSKITGSGEVTLGLYNPVYDPAGTVPHKLTLEGTVALNSVNLASYEALGSTAGRYVAGIDFVHNANGAPNWLYVGGRGEYDSEAANRGAAYFTDDVNMTINTAMPNSQFALERRVYVTTQFNGHALQLIYNNGSFVENNLNAGSFTPLDKAHVVAAGGTWYLLKAAAGGGMLSATETAGTYAVSEGWAAIAKQNGTEVARSKGGLLTVPAAGDYDVTWEIEPIEGTLEIYVDGNDGNDGNDGLTSAKAVKTLAQAMTLIRTSPYTAGKINVVGDYTTTSANEFGTTQVAKPVTVSGSGTNTLTLSGDLYLYGDTTFDNIVMATAVSAQSSTNIFANHHTIHFTSTAKITGALPCLVLGSNTSAAASTAHSVTLDTGTFQSAVLGSYYATGNPAVPGVNYVQNNGSAVSGYVYVGSYGSAAAAGVTYTDDVNIVINAKTNARFVFDRKRDVVKTTFQNGAALQFVFNHNSHQDQNLENNIATLATSIDETTITDASGSLYVLKCAAGGSTLSIVDKGVYKVADAKNWEAVAKQNGVEIARSNDGVLTVPAAGIYDISWEVPKFDGTMTLYVDATNGSDGNDGSAEEPFATLEKAIAFADSAQAKGAIINIVGMLTNPAAPSGDANYTTPVVIQGANGTASSINLTADWTLSTSVTLQNITLNMEEKAIYAHRNSLTIDSSVVINNGGYLYGGVHHSISSYVYTTPYVMTVNGGTFKDAFVGNYITHPGVPNARKAPRADFVLNGGTIGKLWLGINSYNYNNNCSDHHGGNIYTDDVTITINGGTITGGITVKDSIELDNCQSTPENQNHQPTSFEGNALQIILNNGNTVSVLPTAAEVEAKNGQLYVLRCAEGVSLTRTDETGVFNVSAPEGKIVCAMVGNKPAAIAEDGKLTINSAGDYNVVCMDSVPYTISADGKTLTLHQDLELDFNTILPGGTANDLFLGWYNGDDPAIGVLPAGSTLTAKFIKDWNVDENDDGKGDNFFMVGASLREAKGDKTQALRMITQINKSLLSQIPGDVEYGTVLLPNDILSINDLVKGGSYTYNSKQYSAVTVVGEKTFRDTSDFVQYTAALVNIKASSYMTAYAARAYITYTDANGIERTVYVNDTIASSLNEVAEIMIENAASTDNVDAAKAIVAAAKEHVLSKYEKVQLESDMLLSGSSTELHTDIQNSGQYVAADGTVIEYFKLDNGGRYNDTSVITAPTVREITIDAVSGDGATPTVITQLTDFHINYCNEEDIAENNQWTMSSWANRDAMNPCKGGLHYTIAWHRTAMEYATAVSDQMVLTGDIIDYVSHGNFEMVDRYIKQPYSNALMALGNHEPVRVMGLPTDPNDTDPTPRADYYAMLQKVWTNDVYYTSKVLNNEVMVIQLDNSAGNFTNAQVGLLTADLITARENAYTVLVFAHTPFKADSVKLMGNTGFDDGMTLPEAGSTDPTRSVYDLFIEYSDVMRGFFVGHEHSDIYGELTGTKNGEPVSVPQFALSANFGSFGNILQINVQ